MGGPQDMRDADLADSFDLSEWLADEPAGAGDEAALRVRLLADYDADRRRRRSPLRRLADLIGAPALAPRFAPAGALASLMVAGIAVGAVTAPPSGEGYRFAMAALEEEAFLWDAE